MGLGGALPASAERPRRPRRRTPVWTGAFPVVLLAALMVPIPPPNGGGGSSSSSGPPGSYALYPATPLPSALPIKHIVIVMQENHAYDNYFGTYCQTQGPYCSTVSNGTPANVCEPRYLQFPKSGGCDKPWLFPNASSMYRDIVHDKNSSVEAYDNGTNLGFVAAESAGNLTMGEWNWRAIGDYWQAAEQYSVADDFFSSAMSYSLANHWYLLAGAAPMVGIDEYVSATPSFTPVWAQQSLYLNESNQTPAIDDELVNSSASWEYYDYTLPPTYNQSIKNGDAFGYWSPLAAKAETYQSNLSKHFVPRNRFFNATANGTLPNVSWVLPTVPNSEHPPYNVTTGEQWVMNLTNALESSPDWNSTVMFITWDEYGGFYDSVPPPKVDNVGLSFRVPLLVISPWTRENYVDNQFGDFDSLLKLVEWENGLGHLTQRDLNVPLPLDAFDFNSTPRAPIHFGPAQGAPYPVAMQPLGRANPPANVTTTRSNDSITIHWDEPVGGAPVTYYRLTYYPKGTPLAHTIRVDGAANGYVLNGLAANTTYYLSLASYAPSNLSTIVQFHAKTLADLSSAIPPGALPSGTDLTVSTLVAVPMTAFDGAERPARSGRRRA